MADPVKRRYRSTVRTQQAARTRQSVLVAARDLFEAQGYEGTSVAAIAERAGVSVDTVYAAAGRKPELLLAAVDMTLGSTTEPVPAQERDYVVAIREAPTARDKIEVYAAALGRLMPKVVPLLETLAQAAAGDPECARVRDAIAERRAANMRLFAADLRATGELRSDLTDEEVADIVWAMNSADYYALLVHARGWTAERYGRHIADAWRRVLLGPTTP